MLIFSPPSGFHFLPHSISLGLAHLAFVGNGLEQQPPAILIVTPVVFAMLREMELKQSVPAPATKRPKATTHG